MADEIKLRFSVIVENGSFLYSFSPGLIEVDQAAAGRAGAVQSIGFAAAEAVVLTDISSKGVAIFRNLDATNYVDIGPESGGSLYPFARLLPGEAGVIRLVPNVSLYAQANTAAVKLDVTVLEN